MQKERRLRNKKTAADRSYFVVSLSALRLEHGLSQQELADKLGITASAVSLIESGKRIPSFEVASKWLEVLGSSIAERSDIVSDIAQQIKLARKRGGFEKMASSMTINAHRVTVSEAVDNLVGIVNADLEGISTARLSKKALADIRACVFGLADKLLAAN